MNVKAISQQSSSGLRVGNGMFGLSPVDKPAYQAKPSRNEQGHGREEHDHFADAESGQDSDGCSAQEKCGQGRKHECFRPESRVNPNVVGVPTDAVLVSILAWFR